MTFCAGEDVPRAYVTLGREECNFDGGDARRPAWDVAPDAGALERFRVGIVGAGFGGLCAAIRLQELGIPFTIYEKNDAAGGTWYENSFPDLRVDVPNHFYSYSFVPNPDWTSFFAERDELRRYLDGVVEEYGLAPHIRLGNRAGRRRPRRGAGSVEAPAPHHRARRFGPRRRDGRGDRGPGAHQRGGDAQPALRPRPRGARRVRRSVVPRDLLGPRPRPPREAGRRRRERARARCRSSRRSRRRSTT